MSSTQYRDSKGRFVKVTKNPITGRTDVHLGGQLVFSTCLLGDLEAHGIKPVANQESDQAAA